MPEEKPFQLDVKALSKKVPILVRGQAEDAFKAINSFDGLMPDGKSDLAQFAKLFYVGQHVATKANGAIDFDKLADYIVELPFVTNKPVLKAAILEAAAAIEKADDK